MLAVSFVVKAQESSDFAMYNSSPSALYFSKNEPEVVHTAVSLFKDDVKAVFGNELKSANIANADILIGSLANNEWRKWASSNKISTDSLAAHAEAFLLKVIHTSKKPQLLILGSDKRGAAYGVLSFSRMLGVSPWHWWADCTPEKRSEYVLDSEFELFDYPKVAYRGIFVNDEDWGMAPWSSENYEPRMRSLNGGSEDIVKGEIGPYTHERIFELLLRLKANTFWPAMHECSKPFYKVEGNREMARKYGIIISTSHCEPMMRNTNGEWRLDGKGEYDFIHNADNVKSFWQKRLDEVKDDDCIFTLGMRGVHDSGMKGASSLKERVDALQKIIGTQRDMLSSTTRRNIADIPQQFIPYKEVLECYQNGLRVPDDVTLMWCDDNYGYIRHFPTAEEQKRKGGNGIYYHISYWGRPHDYLWLASTHPEMMQSEMNRAYNSGIRNTWIVNVGDIKPAEYLTSLFLDMAWDIEKVNDEGLNKHRADWYAEQVHVTDRRLSVVWDLYYDLCFSCRPEFLGGTRTEEKDPAWKQIRDLNMNEKDIKDRLAKVDRMLRTFDIVESTSSYTKSPAWFELVSYPVLAVATMNQKMLGAQMARHGLVSWDVPEDAQAGIAALCRRYNSFLDGKWKGMIDYEPRNLPVFKPVTRTTLSTPMPEGESGEVVFESYESCVGYNVKKNATMSFEVEAEQGKPLTIEVRLLPIHPSESDGKLEFKIKFEDSEQTASIRTRDREEEWKQNVLRNYSSKQFTFTPKQNGKTYVTITPLFDGFKVQKIIAR